MAILYLYMLHTYYSLIIDYWENGLIASCLIACKLALCVCKGDTLYWGRELGILMIRLHFQGVGHPMQCWASSRCPPSLDIMASHSFVSVPVLDNMRGRTEPETHLWMSCLFNVPRRNTARELGPALHCLALNCELFATLFWVYRLMLSRVSSYVEPCIVLCWAVCMKLFCSRCLYKAPEKGGAITEGELDTPCLANTVLQLSKPVWPNIFNSDKSKQSQTREGWIFDWYQNEAVHCI